MIRPFKATHPQVATRPPTWTTRAQVIGDVVIGAETRVWMNVVIRGDVNTIRIGRQHEHPGPDDGPRDARHRHPTIVGDEVTVGHSAVILHGMHHRGPRADRAWRDAAERRAASATTRSSPRERC